MRSPERLVTAAVLMTAIACVGCDRAREPNAAPTAVASATAPTAPASNVLRSTATIDPCSLLDAAIVRKVVPDAGAGVRDTADLAAGIQACMWGTGENALSLQAYDAPPGAAEAEIRGLSFGLIDPKSPHVGTAVRLEALRDIGDMTIALAEKVDARRGTRRANAIVLTQKENRIVVIRAPSLAAGERDVALGMLRELAAEAAARL